ncbi:MAG: hypothetical protein M0R80_18060 [Proteobacteria bacterium]|jgi:hypothetical protein|nr:hypothetical protein [Pseudomonadota bacterium]
MRTIYVVSMFAFAFSALAGSACDSIPGMGNAQQPIVQPVQGIQPVQMPTMPTTVPGAIPAVPTTPVAATPTVPGAVAVPGVPAAAVAAPTVPVAAAVPVAPTPTGDLLTDRLNEVKFQQGADKTATSALTKVALAAAKSQSYQVQLPGPPYCHTIVAVGDDAVKNVDVTLESPLAVPEAMDSTLDNRAFIANHCPTVAGAYKLTVKMTDGAGEVAIQVFSK